MITIVDYQMGNLHSVKRKLDRLHVASRISSDPEEIRTADKLILPGVGHFGKAMEQLQKKDLVAALNDAVLERNTPILGICLGMQLMARLSYESSDPQGCEGLGWFDAEVVRLEVSDTLRYKIPHTGWNTATTEKEDSLFKNINDPAEFYFVHAYHVQTNDQADILTTTEYETPFVSAISKNRIYGVQFHPEKSHDTGLRLIENFVKL
jgi:glutamine amidotransferase